ncbi:unnamed protein product [Calypogeia fissa]
MMRSKRERGQRAERGESSRVNDNVDVEDEVDVEKTKGVEMGDTDRRLLRSKYRALKSFLNDSKAKIAHPDGGFMEIVERVDKLYAQATKPREQATDAELYNELTDQVYHLVRGAQNKGGMSAAEFVGAIIHTYGLPGSVDGDPGQSLDWEALGLEACAVLRVAPGMSTMVGPMDVGVKARRTTGPRRRDRPTEKTRPQQVEEADADKPNTETEANINTMFQILIRRKECQIDHLVLNRVSFAQTIENLFALSFLVKDGRVEFKFGENGSQVVVPRNAPAHADRAAGEGLNTQFVFRLDFQCWRLMQEEVAEGEELMPHRGNREQSPGIPAARTPIRKNSRNRARETPAAVPQAGDSPEDDPGEGSSRRLKRRVF